ncbi:TonB-dependent receptor [Rheinheimera oceanensis]|uniref:TonB-dependent receptor n=1 Tax=Rheinheimera oceanensis TaxID=2817449 RepID=UPI001BFE216E|nr:TonB-dependent receptor [Rheinheimera oceanensis]
MSALPRFTPSRIALSLLLCSPLLQANDDAIEHIQVSATRSSAPVSTVPATITVITQEQIASQLAFTQDISAILGNLLPGFSPSRQKLTSAGETLRGREPLYMIDGVPQSNPLRNGSRDGKTIDPAMIERIEVIRGANAIQGMGASGGIINIITKSAADNRHQLSAGFTTPTAGGSDSQSYKASYLHSYQQQGLAVVAGVAASDSGMYRDGNGKLIGVDGTQGDTMDSRSIDVFIKARQQLSNTETLQLMVNHYKLRGNGNYVQVAGNVNEGIAATSVRGETEGRAPQNKVTTATLDYTNQAVFGGSLSWQLFLQDFAALYGGGRFAAFQDPAYGENLYDQSQNKSTKYGSRLTWFKPNLAVNALDLSTGVDWLQDKTYQELALTGRNWVPEAKFNNIAPFAQLRYSAVPDWTFSLGSRYEYGKLKVADFTTLASYNSTFVVGGEPDFTELLLNAGAVWQLHANVRLYASYSEGFSMPDVGRVLRDINTPGLSVDSFLTIQPVISDNLELGVEFNFDNWQLRASAYRSDSDLGSRLEPDADGIYSVMREKTEIDGIEAEGQYYFSTDSQLGFSYARTNGRFDSDNDGKVDTDLGGVNIAPERLNLHWQQQWLPKLSSRLQANILFSHTLNTAEQFNGYTTLDLSSSYDTNYGRWTLGIENLTDKQYFTYYAQSTPANARYFAGIGRTLNLSWSHSF